MILKKCQNLKSICYGIVLSFVVCMFSAGCVLADDFDSAVSVSISREPNFTIDLLSRIFPYLIGVLTLYVLAFFILRVFKSNAK